MKYVVLAVLFAIVQAISPIPRKAANQPARDDHSTKHDSSNEQHHSDTRMRTPSTTESNQPEGKGPSSHDAPDTVSIREPAAVPHKDGWDKAYIIFTGLLVIVGSLGVGYAVKTMRAIEQQAREMAGQRGIMQGQLETMNSQVAEMKAAAIMAQKQFDITVSKEKPRLSIEIEPLEFVRADYVNARVKFRVRYSGITPAFITDSVASAQIGDSPSAPSPSYLLAMDIPKTVLADTEEMTRPVFPPNFSSDDMDALAAGTQFIHFVGFIKYTDVFTDRERETTFCFLWKVNLLYGPDARSGRWVKRGPPEANRET